MQFCFQEMFPFLVMKNLKFDEKETTKTWISQLLNPTFVQGDSAVSQERVYSTAKGPATSKETMYFLSFHGYLNYKSDFKRLLRKMSFFLFLQSPPLAIFWTAGIKNKVKRHK